MTEASHQMASNPQPPAERKPGSVGPGTGVRISIMDDAGNHLAGGARGEVVIQGPNVVLGYENNPEANAKSFTNGWFRTGDQGYLDTDGYLFLTGRLKDIINRGGEKISPRQVDEVLLAHPEVLEAVTFPVAHPSLGEEVAAAVVLRQPGAATAKQLREFTASRLAAFKVPRQVVIVSQIPKGATGKIQRAALAGQLGVTAADQNGTETTGAFEPPQTATEKLIADIWGEVLGLKQVGRRDNFFQLGGDSLIAARILNRVHARLHVDVPFIDFFEKPSVAGVAETIEQGERDTPTPGSSSCGIVCSARLRARENASSTA